MSVDIPLIYCNGDSYSNELYHRSLVKSVYANILAEQTGGFVINKAINGSCNRRIIRTTIHDVVQQRQLNPTQQIIALIGLTFELRSELWVDNLLSTVPEESNFITHQFSKQINWKENLLANKNIGTENNHQLDDVFYKGYSRGRAYFYSPYAERINLLTDLLMLKSLLDSLNIDFLIFQSPKAEKLQSDYLLDFLKQQVYNDNRISDLEEFGFVDWCCENQFVPLDFLDRTRIGHYGPEAHRAFAEQFLIPKLHELSIL